MSGAGYMVAFKNLWYPWRVESSHDGVTWLVLGWGMGPEAPDLALLRRSGYHNIRVVDMAKED